MLNINIYRRFLIAYVDVVSLARFVFSFIYSIVSTFVSTRVRVTRSAKIRVFC